MSIKSDVRKVLTKIASDLEQGSYRNEDQVISSGIMSMLYALGWNVFDADEIRKQYAVEDKKVDIALFYNSRPLIFIEAKAVGKITDDSVKQAFFYASGEGVPILILTDGKEWNFYLPLSTGKRNERQFHQLNISEDQHDECIKIFCTYLSRAEIISERAREKAEKTLRERKAHDEKRNEETIRESMEKAWNNILTSSDFRDLLTKEIKRNCGHFPSNDMTEDFLSNYFVTEGPSAKSNNISNIETHPSQKFHSNDPFLNPKIKITGVMFENKEYSATKGIRVLLLALELFTKKDNTFLVRFKQASMTSRNNCRVSQDRNDLFLNNYNDDVNAGMCEQLAVPGGWWVYINLSKRDCRALLINACKVMKITYEKEFKVLFNK